MDSDTAMMLGKVEGTLEGIAKCQEEHTRILVGIEERLRKVETKATVQGGVAALCVAVTVEMIKMRLGWTG